LKIYLIRKETKEKGWTKPNIYTMGNTGLNQKSKMENPKYEARNKIKMQNEKTNGKV